MPILKSRSRTPAERAASQRNGHKSRGPKTPGGKKVVSLNALKTGARARPATRPLWQAMADLGEDPKRYRSTLEDICRSYPPHNPLELKVCEDITRLLLKSERNQQAQEAKLVRTYEKLQSSRQKQRREMESSYDAPQAEVLETGLRRAPDSPAKFSEITACLARLQEQVEDGDFSDGTELQALYGKNPTFRGAGLINGFHALAENPENEELLASVRLMILEEMRDVTEANHVYYREHVEVSRAMRLECLAPVADPEYVQLQRQENMLHRQLERKIKLLLSLRTATRREAQEEMNGKDEKCKTGKEAGRVMAFAPEPAAQPGSETEHAPLEWLETAPARSEKSGVPSGRAPRVSASKLGGSPQQARATALRHKLDKPRVSTCQSQNLDPDVLRQINEIYGLEPDPPERPNASAGRDPSPAANGSSDAPDTVPGPSGQRST